MHLKKYKTGTQFQVPTIWSVGVIVSEETPESTPEDPSGESLEKSMPGIPIFPAHWFEWCMN